MCRTGNKLSEIRKPLERYASSGEINTTVADIGKVIEQIGRDYADHTQDHLDGLTVDWILVVQRSPKQHRAFIAAQP